MEDVFIEKIVARRPGAREMAIKLGAVLLVAVVAAASFMIPILQMFAPLMILGAGFLGWKLWSRSSVEYEYSFSSGTLTIDAIYGQQKRKTLLSVTVSESLELMASVSEEYGSELSRTASQTIDAASSPDAIGRQFMNIKGDAGVTRVFFEPDERMINAMRRAAPTRVK